jgi:hypothetical protein
MNDRKLAEEIAEALFILQKANGESLASMISDYRPAAFGKVWGNDADYHEMVKQFAVADAVGDSGAGERGKSSGAGKTRKLKRPV